MHNTDPKPGRDTPPLAASSLGMADGGFVSSAFVGDAVAPGVTVVVGPKGYGRVSVETETPVGPIVIVWPLTTVVVVPVPGPTV